MSIQRYYYSNGKLKSKVLLNNGKKEGKYKEYFQNGEIKIICNYINDMIDNKLEGKYTEYFSDGTLYKCYYYINNKRMVKINYIMKMVFL